MASILKVDTIQDQSGNNIINESGDTITIGASGDTVNVVGTLQNNGNNAVGITMADSWRLSADVGFEPNGVISTNWEQVDESRSLEVGSPLTQSSGVFTFPQTGIYLIIFSIQFNIKSDDNAEVSLEFTSDDTNFDSASVVKSGNNNATYTNENVTNTFMCGITDISNQKFRFNGAGFTSTGRIRGNTGVTETGFSIIRLGDT